MQDPIVDLMMVDHSGEDASQTEDTHSEPSATLTTPQQEESSVLDDDILTLLGKTPTKEKKYGPNLHKDLAVRFEHIVTSGLTKEQRKELLDTYDIPENCTRIDAPLLNPEIKAATSDALVKKDKAIEFKQKKIAAAITCVGVALTYLFNQEPKDPLLIKPLIAAGQLICDTQHTESVIRRGFITSSIKKDFKEQLVNTEIDKYIFGEKLAETLKTAKAISKSGAEIRSTPAQSSLRPKPSTSTQNLNSKRPFSTSRQPGAMTRKRVPAPATQRAARPAPPPPPPPSPRSQPRPYHHR